MLALQRRYAAGLFPIVLALWAILLCRLSGQEEVVVGVPYHGRGGMEGRWSEVIGYFVNMLPIRIQVGRLESCAGVIDMVK